MKNTECMMMCEYDYDLLKSCKNYLEELKEIKPFPWWKRLNLKLRDIIMKPVFHPINTGNTMAFGSFRARNPFHEMTEKIDEEYLRILGRKSNLYD